MTYRLTVSPDFAHDRIAAWYLFNTWLQRRIETPIHLELYYDFGSQREAIEREEIDLIYANAFDVTHLVRGRGFTTIAAPLGAGDEVVVAVPAESACTRVEDLRPGARIAATGNPDVNRIGMILLEPADLDAGNTSLVTAATYPIVAKQLIQGKAEAGFFLKQAFDDLGAIARRALRPVVASEISVMRHLMLGAPRVAPLAAAIEPALLAMPDDPAGRNVLESLGLAGWAAYSNEDTELMIDLIATLKGAQE